MSTMRSAASLMTEAYHQVAPGQWKTMTQIEDELFVLRQQRRRLSEKVLCVQYGLTRSALQRAVRRAQKRHARIVAGSSTSRTVPEREGQQIAGEY